MTLACSSGKLSRLRDRAKMLAQVRTFFDERGVWEVDCPHLNPFPAIDAHIDPIPAEGGYLHTSPEYAMKKLIAEGSGDIYQLSHVFRKGERGHQHLPEFTLIEWYHIGMPFDALIHETAQLCALFLGTQSLTQTTYQEAFLKYVGIDPLTASIETLRKQLPESNEDGDRDDLLNLILGVKIEPYLGERGITALTHYPPSQAALAQVTESGAERFELYYQGVELANGYHELNDSEEQRMRFEEANRQRLQLNKEPFALDEPFIQCLDQLPDCCGVAVGFDRLMMLRHHITEITEVTHV